ncbi:MAG: hypothetical protein ACRCZE_04045 [Candidatus Altimarinota bacterium]
MSAEKKMYDEIDGEDLPEISRVELTAKDEEEVLQVQRESLKDKVAQLVYRESSGYHKQLSVLSATVAELIHEAVHDLADEKIFYERFKVVMGKKRAQSLKEGGVLETQLEEWLSKQKLPIRNEEGKLEMWDFKACMLTNPMIRPTVSVTRADSEGFKTVGLFELMKNLGEANLDWDD